MQYNFLKGWSCAAGGIRCASNKGLVGGGRVCVLVRWGGGGESPSRRATFDGGAPILDEEGQMGVGGGGTAS